VVVEPDGGASGLARDDDVVFKALADATRRDLLDALYAADGQTLGQLAARHPHLTRFGVMKHLAVLEDAGLVVAEKVGREKRHYLNPVPIAQIAGRWISRYARPFTTALVGLKVGLEAPASDPPHPRPSTHDEESR
jgi:DNA-binding transcriptional ArsR family regulator